MKLHYSVALSAFLCTASILPSPEAAFAQGDLPLPANRPPQQAGQLRLQRAAPPNLRADPFSDPAPLPLPPEPSPFPSFPTRNIDPSPVEVDLRKRAKASLVPDGPNPTEDAALQLRDRVRYREVKARAMAQPEVRSSLETVAKTRSDRELRDAWRQHYTSFFAAMRALDRTLEPLIAQREKEALTPLQERLPRSATAR
jgi:hypothetical protein